MRAATSHAGRYGILLATLALILVLGFPIADLGSGYLFSGALYAAMLVACGVAVGESPRARVAAIAIAIALTLADASLAFGQSSSVVVVISALRTLFLGFVTGAILTHITRANNVTADTMLGGICVFLLLGLFFYALFAAIEFLRPGSFSAAGVAVSDFSSSDRAASRYPVLVYYSFVALSTVGFGDITPTWSLPRALSSAEAVIGQLYLAIFVATLVGMRVAHRSSRRDQDPG